VFYCFVRDLCFRCLFTLRTFSISCLFQVPSGTLLIVAQTNITGTPTVATTSTTCQRRVAAIRSVFWEITRCCRFQCFLFQLPVVFCFFLVCSAAPSTKFCLCQLWQILARLSLFICQGTTIISLARTVTTIEIGLVLPLDHAVGYRSAPP